jgi:hypothetical protein
LKRRVVEREKDAAAGVGEIHADDNKGRVVNNKKTVNGMWIRAMFCVVKGATSKFGPAITCQRR